MNTKYKVAFLGFLIATIAISIALFLSDGTTYISKIESHNNEMKLYREDTFSLRAPIEWEKVSFDYLGLEDKQLHPNYEYFHYRHADGSFLQVIEFPHGTNVGADMIWSYDIDASQSRLIPTFEREYICPRTSDQPHFVCPDEDDKFTIILERPAVLCGKTFEFIFGNSKSNERVDGRIFEAIIKSFRAKCPE